VIAIKETTDWGNAKAPNHTYLLEGSNLIAYIKQGESAPFYFKNPIKGFDKRGRKFDTLKSNPFKTFEVKSSIVRVEGSKGAVYEVDTETNTCTCPGYTFRGSCKHTKELV